MSTLSNEIASISSDVACLADIEEQRKSRGALADPGPCDLLEILELCSGVGERWILLFPKLRQGPGCGFVTIDDSVECDRAYRAYSCLSEVTDFQKISRSRPLTIRL